MTVWRTSSRHKEGPGIRGLSFSELHFAPVTAFAAKMPLGGQFHLCTLSDCTTFQFPKSLPMADCAGHARKLDNAEDSIPYGRIETCPISDPENLAGGREHHGTGDRASKPDIVQHLLQVPGAGLCGHGHIRLPVENP